MLTILGPRQRSLCDGVSRRSFLKAATAGTVSLLVGCDDRGEIVQGDAGDTATADSSAADSVAGDIGVEVDGPHKPEAYRY